MPSFNKVILAGHLTEDPELKQTTTGTYVTSFSIGVNRRFAKEGERQSDFFNIVCWRQTAELVTKYCRKGDPLLICGSLQTRLWVDKNGSNRTAVEVVADEVTFLKSKQSTEPAPLNGAAKQQPQFEELDTDDELPF